MKTQESSRKKYTGSLVAHALGTDDTNIMPPIPKKWASIHKVAILKNHPNFSHEEINNVINEIWVKIYTKDERKRMIVKELTGE